MAKRKRAPERGEQASESTVVIDSSVLLAIGDELDAIESVLQMVPNLTVLANIVTGSRPIRHAMFHDEFAHSVHEKLGLDVNSFADESAQTPFSNLCDIPNSAEAVLDAARWRLRRVTEFLQAVIKSAPA